VIGAMVAIAAWQLLATSKSALYLPTLRATLSAAQATLVEPQYWRDLLATCRRSALGFLLAAITGVPLGLLLGVWDAGYRFVSLPVDFVRSIPTAALLPVFLVVFGLGDLSKIAVVYFGCVFVFFIGSLYGARGGPDTLARKQAIRVMGGGRVDQFVYVVIPEAVLSVATSLRLAASLALVLAVFTEMFLGSDDGVGRRLIDAYLSFRIPLMYVYIATLGLVGVTVNGLLESVERRYVASRM
jgi:NitT/TauT family transport system permease protein